MWGKKPEQQEQPVPPSKPEPKIATPPKIAPAPMEATKMSTDALRPSATPSGSTARLGPSLHEDRKLTVGASSKVTADVIAREVVVYGSVKGNLRAKDRIEIKKDGSVVGDLTTARIMIEDGAYFKGSIEIDKTGDAAAAKIDLDKPAYARAATAPAQKS
jgi:hypothetical protein